MQFLCAVSHSVGAHAAALQPRQDASTSDQDDSEADNLPLGTHDMTCCSDWDDSHVIRGLASMAACFFRLLLCSIFSLAF